MSPEDVEIVRRAVLAASDGDFSRFDAANPSIEWDTVGRSGLGRAGDLWRPAGIRVPGVDRHHGGVGQDRYTHGFSVGMDAETPEEASVKLDALLPENYEIRDVLLSD